MSKEKSNSFRVKNIEFTKTKYKNAIQMFKVFEDRGVRDINISRFGKEITKKTNEEKILFFLADILNEFFIESFSNDFLLGKINGIEKIYIYSDFTGNYNLPYIFAELEEIVKNRIVHKE
jgi:hypothetical protein